ncbi:Threonine/homoserine/homoserine lactone efflux protein [Malonomonas rubra DSM 5091]|uniref:Threonine/homoserine/homoserine lactone efflux protein n=1 Tax=Malonomonas rubra DSM 5091 TaxID=1122189 RepID=A0A1M6IVH6_MALRU|nr:LysE family translocator [Malonomonas rubra]SHJ38339.1 Threonine/homoserine/homoserine lactone efflux protein [Malonomonas rubra DSM 5091]
MFSVTTILPFLTVSFLIAVSPGPSWLYTISTTLSQGRRAGMAGNLGNSTGILCHALATGFGLSLLLQYSSTTFHLLKFLGVFYLCYLAWRNFRGNSLLDTGETRRNKRSLGKIFFNGIFVSLFNPKIFLLMVALLPQFVSPDSNNPQLQLALLGSLHALVAGLLHTFLIFFSAEISRRIKASGRAQKWLRWATGTLFLGFGARLAMAGQGS